MNQKKEKNNFSNREIGKIREKQPIIDYAKHEGLKIIESPIISVPESNKSIPDAIILDPNNSAYLWLEHTSFIRVQEMYQWDAAERKTGKFSVHTICLSVDELLKLFICSVSKKLGKNYSAFTNSGFFQSKQIQKKGILLVEFRDSSPFFDERELRELINRAKDKHILRSLKLSESCFYKIVLKTDIFVNGKWIKTFDTIWSAM